MFHQVETQTKLNRSSNSSYSRDSFHHLKVCFSSCITWCLVSVYHLADLTFCFWHGMGNNDRKIWKQCEISFKKAALLFDALQVFSSINMSTVSVLDFPWFSVILLKWKYWLYNRKKKKPFLQCLLLCDWGQSGHFTDMEGWYKNTQAENLVINRQSTTDKSDTK